MLRRLRQATHGRRHVGLRIEVRNEVLDLPLALVTRRLQQTRVIVVREVRGQQTDCRQCDLAASQLAGDHRKPAHRARGGDAVVGRMLREAQRSRAEHEERRVALTEIEPAGIYFCEEDDEICRRASLARGGLGCRIEELSIRELYQRAGNDVWAVARGVFRTHADDDVSACGNVPSKACPFRQRALYEATHVS
jgi:hypothetical protein